MMPIINNQYYRKTDINLILASTSPYRKQLLQRLGIPFSCDSPDIDESQLPDETPEHQVLRLAEAKAARVAEREPDAIIIGSDQVAVLDGNILGKPGNQDNARAQLRAMSGHCVRFLTGLCLLNTASGHKQLDCVRIDVYFRELSDRQIDRYLEAEQPYQCAGSFKSEALGISLIERFDGPDPTALIGLPLIRLTDMLQNENYNIP